LKQNVLNVKMMSSERNLKEIVEAGFKTTKIIFGQLEIYMKDDERILYDNQLDVSILKYKVRDGLDIKLLFGGKNEREV